MADLTARLYDSAGTSQGTVDLEPAIFGLVPNVPVMHQVVTAQLAAARRGTASTKTRAEVRGGGAKPWAQKGLGRARHGSIRSPQWAGGGVAHGPKPRSYAQRTPKKMKRLALLSALSARAAEGQVVIIDRFDWDAPKTRTAVSLLSAIEAQGKVLVVTDNDTALRSFRNLPQAKTDHFSQINTYDILWAETIVFSSDALESLTAGPKAAAVVVDDAPTDTEEEE